LEKTLGFDSDPAVSSAIQPLPVGEE